MTELAFPEIAEREVADKPGATLKETALASFVPIEAHMRTLAARFKDVAYDVGTTKGMKDAKAARLVLRDEGRYAVQRLQKRLKDEANDLKRTLDSKADELIAITKPVEDAIDAQIAAEEERKEAERAERERIERERVDALQARLSGLSVWIERCKAPDMTAERIRNGINALTAAPLGEDWAEFADRAAARKEEVLEVMREMFRQAAAREAEAERLEAQRVENERVAAENARVAAELKRQADELAAAQRRAEQEAMRYPNGAPMYGATVKENGDLLMLDPLGKRSVFCDVDEEYTEGQGSQQVLKAEPATADATDRDNPANASPVGGPMGVGQLAAAGPADGAGQQSLTVVESDSTPDPVWGNRATVNLGEINARLGFLMTASFVQETLQIKAAGREKAAIKFHASDWGAIKLALAQYVSTLP